jgi:hypothetical protein
MKWICSLALLALLSAGCSTTPQIDPVTCKPVDRYPAEFD